jgi:hypothetical protein
MILIYGRLIWNHFKPTAIENYCASVLSQQLRSHLQKLYCLINAVKYSTMQFIYYIFQQESHIDMAQIRKNINRLTSTTLALVER